MSVTATARAALAAVAAVLVAGCATRAENVRPVPASPAEFLSWSCDRMLSEVDGVQKRAADLAWAVDQRAGNNILALGLGITVFWPAMLALRADGPEAAELARLKGRYEALRQAMDERRCPPPTPQLTAEEAAALPVAVGERLVYEDRAHPRRPSVPWVLQVNALLRSEVSYQIVSTPGAPAWRHDAAGNVLEAPVGVLSWPRLLRHGLDLGDLVDGELHLVGDPLARARLRGQVVAVGSHSVADRRFDAAVVELFGDAQLGEAFTRVNGALVVDRRSGVLLRLDLRSAHETFALQRRLMRVEPAAP
jgi:hypothetical protein